MKKFVALILTLSMLLALVACGSESTETTNSSGPANEYTTVVNAAPDDIVVEAPPQETEAPSEPISDTGNLGDYEVIIGESEFIQDFNGEDAILIHFSFTNNSEENQSAMFALTYTAFQNGIGLEEAIIADDSIHDPQDLMKDIQPGTTIDLTLAYLLSNDSAPVEFFITDIVLLNDTKLGKTYEVSPDGVTELSVAPGVESATELGDYAISLNSYEIVEDYEGNPTIVLNMGYTNNSDYASPFYAAIEVTVFQDGIELESAYFIDDSIVDSTSSMLNVMPGAGHAVTEAFVLSNSTSPVEIEITEMFGFSDEKITTTINIVE